MSLHIDILSAGAGSGKTYTLTGRMVDLLKTGIRPAGILATTFTQKAAAELQERVRVRLLEAGMTEQANELGTALIGTVHSIGIRLLQRFAFEAGVSPLVEVIAAGDSQRLFNESLSQVLTESRIEGMNRLADRLGLTKKTLGEPYDWRRLIRDLTDVARANNFSRAVLEKSKRQSWETFERLLPPAQNTDALQWQNRLSSAIDQAIAALEANEADQTKVSREAGETLRAMQNQLKWRGELYWHEWIKIAKTEVSAKSRDLLEDLRNLARSCEENRQFRQDIKDFIDLVFDISMDALGEFAAYKKKRGLIDYTDMETYVSLLLRNDSVCEVLRDELDLLLVDEFQDTSPIQLDIFLQLSRLAKKSIWVGDPKQSIYGFRGAEPALMQAIIEATGGIDEANILKKSWRSRADIVDAVNDIFVRAFPDMPKEQVVLEANFSLEKENAICQSLSPEALPHPALMHWHFKSELDERKPPGQPWLENCIADQVRTLLARQLPVFHKKRDALRPVRPGDIAILCRNNKDCIRMAEALHRAGLKAAIARTGLLETPEARLALACLKYLLTPSDALSIAEILLLTGSMNLEEMVNNRLEWLYRNAQSDADTDHPERMAPWALDHPFIQVLSGLRPRTADLSASEILNLLLDELDLRRTAAQLGNANQRIDNLERLRHYALEYESACSRLHSAASLGGFLLWLDTLAGLDEDRQGSGENEDAVKVLTYHRSKGLEYPVAICHNLDQPLKEQVWGLNLVSETEKPDLDNILGNRWLRFWVNPFADQLKRTRLEEALHQSSEWTQATRSALDEEARLLYVGLTRARDYLVFPTTLLGTKWLNRVFNKGDESIPTLDPHSDETPFYRQHTPPETQNSKLKTQNSPPIHIQTEISYKPKEFPESLPDETPIPFHAPRKGRHTAPRLPLLIDPQQTEPPGFKYRLGEPQAFAAWLEFKDDYSTAFGKAIQSVFQADHTTLSSADRLALAQQQLDIRGVAEMATAGQLARQSAAFRQWLLQQVPEAALCVRYPLEGLFDRRLIRVEADLYAETPESHQVIQFAGFAEGMKKWKTQAQALAPYAAWVHWLLKQTTPNKPVFVWLVFPVEGQVVRVEMG